MVEPAARWTVIVAAGQRPGIDPLASAFGEQWKALVRVGGEAMLSRVVRTLASVPAIGEIIILAQDGAALVATPDTAWLADHPQVRFATSGQGISQSVHDCVTNAAKGWPVLLTTADHPLLTRAMVEAFIAQASGADVAVAMVERRTLLAAYPGNQRTWLHFRGGAYSGANLFALNSPGALAALDVWRSVEQDRKKGWKLLWRFGPWLALRALTRTIGLAAALASAAQRLGFSAKAVILPMAEAAIDVDKPSDHMLAEQILRGRTG